MDRADEAIELAGKAFIAGNLWEAASLSIDARQLGFKNPHSPNSSETINNLLCAVGMQALGEALVLHVKYGRQAPERFEHLIKVAKLCADNLLDYVPETTPDGKPNPFGERCDTLNHLAWQLGTGNLGSYVMPDGGMPERTSRVLPRPTSAHRAG